MEQSKEVVYTLRYKDIRVKQFSQYELTKSFNSNNFPSVEFQTTFNFRILQEEDIVTCILSVKIKILETNELYAELIVENDFVISPLKALITTTDGEQNIPAPIIQTVTAISTSTIRGILYERLKGSNIQKEIYPLIDVPKLFEEGITTKN